MSSLSVTNAVPRDDLTLGIVYIEGVSTTDTAPELAKALDACIERRSGDLSAEDDQIRKAARDILRNGSYKPTGRGKPASEYLLRAATSEDFPRISGPVDVNNLMSLELLLPISVWDVDLAGGRDCRFSLGAEDESYVFNPSGQSLALKDLICGYSKHEDCWSPHVTPIKDSMKTKIVDASKVIAGCIYFPNAAYSTVEQQEATSQFLNWLLTCGDACSGGSALVHHGETKEISI